MKADASVSGIAVHPDETLEGFAALCQRTLHCEPCSGAVDPGERAPRGDDDLNPGALDDFDRLLPRKPPRLAAVLVPIILKDEALHVVLTTRGEGLPTHAGQIAFPGGKLDETDATVLSCALREAHEEIALPPDRVEPVGYLDSYQTVTGFRISPCVGLVADVPAFVPETGEVADVFTVPLAFLMDSRNHRRESREWKGAIRYFYAMPFEDRYIWGATAGMLRNLFERLMAGQSCA